MTSPLVQAVAPAGSGQTDGGQGVERASDGLDAGPATRSPWALLRGWSGRRAALIVAGAALGGLVLAGTWVGSSTWLRRDAAMQAEVGPDASYIPTPGSVAVLPVQMVEASGDTAWLRDGLAEIIVSEITNDPGLQVVPRSQVTAALSARGVLDPALVPNEAGLSAARDLRVERLVTASFQRVDQQFTLTARIVDVKAAAVAREVVVHGERRAELLDAVNNLCRDLTVALRQGRAVPGTPPGDTPPPTRSEDAYRAYTEALVAEARGSRVDLELAEWRLGEALKFDPGFARAYLRIALIQDTRRRWGYGVEDPAPAIRAARKLESRLPDRERLLVRGMALRYLDNQPYQAIEHWRMLLKLYPTFAEDAGVPALVADTQLKLGLWDDLILTAEPHVESAVLTDHERAVLCGLLARAFQRRGEFDRATTYATRAVDLWPAREGPALLRARTQLGRVLADAGSRDRAAGIFRGIAADPRADVVNLTDAAWGFYMIGDRAQAAQVVERALATDAGYGNAYHLRGWLRLTAGNYDGAASDLRGASERTPIGFGSPDTGVIKGDLAALYYEGVAHQKAGRPAAAHAVWRELIARARDAGRGVAVNPVVRWQADYLVAIGSARLGLPVTMPDRLERDEAQSMIAEARIHAVLGRRTEALEDLRQAVSLGAGDFQHIRDDPNYDVLRTSPEFVRLLQTFSGRRGT
jgi:tetratricopeptide (TPR) repeat protein/TolB-like protein